MNRIVALIALAATTAVSQSFGRFTYSVLYTDIRDDFGLSNTAAGGIGSLNLVGYLLGSLIVAFGVGRLGLIRTAKYGLAGVTVGLALLTWAPTAAVVVFALFITGLTASGVWVAAPALAANVLGSDRQGLAVGWISAGVGAGFVLSCIFDVVMSDWRSVYGTETLLGIACLVLFSLIFKDSSPSSSAQSPSPKTLQQVPGWLNLCATYGFFAIGGSLAMTFTVALLEEDAGYEAHSASLIYSLIGVGMLIGGFSMGWLIDQVGRNSTQLLSLAVMATSCVMIATGHKFGATVATMLFGVAFTGAVTSITAKVSHHLDAEAFGAAYAVVTIVFGAGLAIGPQLGGVIADSSGSFRPALLLAASCATLGLALTVADRRQEKRDVLSRHP
ncbi:MAG: MFS transporter [Actinomycetota bacterium]|nr:MFS transporter [Acidimicrobiales bacterium]MED5542361.1 MFS transporter [Actinomycetota bacterium]MEE2680671.1 MFS transporter [Actinomycetota bacterium]MEE2807234.1 MFS transporter [Actinomycetota bacterium]